MHTKSFNLLAGALLAAGIIAAPAYAGPWTAYPTITEPPTLGVPAGPIKHPGKEYMWEDNRDAVGNQDDGQVIAWDGNGGRTDSQIDYNVAKVDALANHGDAYFNEVTTNKTAILYSERTTADWGKATDTSFPIYYETTGGANGGWATRNQVNQDWIAIQADLDKAGNGEQLNLIGLEVFGPNDPQGDDSDMFSVNGDTALLPGNATKYSIYSFQGGVIGGYLTTEALATALTSFYTDATTSININDIDLDAMMVQDRNGNYEWDDGDSILFSLMPISSVVDSSGKKLMDIGDAAYVWDNQATDKFGYLNHGGHEWVNNWNGTNIDALEAAIPEPASIALLGIGLLGLLGTRRRKA